MTTFSHRSPIVGLLVPRCPSAIGWLIAVVVVGVSVNGVCIARPHPHVGNEVFERMPAVANCDPATAIVFERLVFRVLASVDHSAPSAVFCRSRKAVTGGALDLLASARNSVAGSNGANSCGEIFAAFASELPVSLPRFVPLNEFDGRKTAVSFASGHHNSCFSRHGAELLQNSGKGNDHV